jgi:hypothetical protein
MLHPPHLADIKMPFAHPDKDWVAIPSRLGGFKDCIGGVLNNLENLAIYARFDFRVSPFLPDEQKNLNWPRLLKYWPL